MSKRLRILEFAKAGVGWWLGSLRSHFMTAAEGGGEREHFGTCGLKKKRFCLSGAAVPMRQLVPGLVHRCGRKYFVFTASGHNFSFTAVKKYLLTDAYFYHKTSTDNGKVSH